MKKLKLRTWVKVVIVAIILIGILKVCDDFTKKEVRNCIESGNSKSYCEYELYK